MADEKTPEPEQTPDDVKEPTEVKPRGRPRKAASSGRGRRTTGEPRAGGYVLRDGRWQLISKLDEDGGE